MFKIIILVLIFFLVGCGKKEFITCNIEVDNDLQNYNIKGIYKIYYKENYVTKIEKQEKYISSDETTLKYLYESKNLDYYNLNDLYKGYTYNIKSSKTSLDINAIIDMNLVDVKQMVKDKKIDKDYVISNKLTTSGIVKIYESKGAICNI